MRVAALFDRLIAWMRGSAKTPSANLSEGKVLRIASVAASSAGASRELTLASRSTRDGRIVWSVSEAAIGSVLVVDIDDETATVLAVRRVGLR